MKILSFLNGDIQTLYGRDAAAKKNFYTYKCLSEFHDVTVLANVPIKTRREPSRVNKNFRIIPICLYYPTLLFYLEKLRILPSVFVCTLHGYFSFFIKKHLAAGYDLCVVDGFLLTGWLNQLPDNLPVVYASHNVEYDWYIPKLSEFWAQKYFKNYIFKVEKRLIDRAAFVTTVSEHDKGRFVELYGCESSKIETFPIGFSKEVTHVSHADKTNIRGKYKIPKDKNIVLFCGSNFYSNQEGVDNIINKISPGLDAGNSIIIVGSIAKYINSCYRSLPENIHVLGFVDNISEIYQAADIAVNPILTGSGTNVKTIECVGAGLDLVSTEFGIRGYEALRNNILVCDVNDMAQVINKYLLTKKRIITSTALKNYEWTTIAQRLSEKLISLL